MIGQLENWSNGYFDSSVEEPPKSGIAAQPRLAKLKPNMVEIEDDIKKVRVVDQNGNDLQVENLDEKFFEAAFLYLRGSTYYLTYSTGYSHLLVYATSETIEGPYTYQGKIMSPPEGWTTHHSLVDYKDKTYLFVSFYSAGRYGQMAGNRKRLYTAISRFL